MNCIEELTFLLLDGNLTPDEQAELDRLLVTDEAVRLHVGLLELEAALRATGAAPEVAGDTIARASAIQTDDLERSVMRTIGALPPPSVQGVESRSLRTTGLYIVAAAALFFVVWLAWPHGNRPHAEDKEPAPILLLLECSPDAVVESEEGVSISPSAGTALQPGRTLRTKQTGHATLTYADGTRLELSGGAILTVEPVRSAKRVRLQAGCLRATVPQQANSLPLAIVTSRAELQGEGGTFQVIVLAGHGTRIDLESGKTELVVPGQPAFLLTPNTLAFVPDHGEVFFSPRQTVCLQRNRELTFPGLRLLSFSPDGKTIVATTRWQAVYWHESDKMEALPVSPRGRKGADIEALAGSTVVVSERKDNRLRIWDALKREPRRLIPPLPGGALKAISPKGKWLAFWAGKKRQLTLMDMATDRLTLVRIDHKVYGFAASPNGLLAVGRRNPAPEARVAVDLIEVATGRLMTSLPVAGSASVTLAFSADGQRLAVGTHGKVQVWNMATRRIVSTMDQPGYPIVRLALGPDGRTLAASSIDDRVWVWDVDRSTDLGLVQPGKQPQQLAFSPDGKTLAVLDQGSRITLWTVPR